MTDDYEFTKDHEEFIRKQEEENNVESKETHSS